MTEYPFALSVVADCSGKTTIEKNPLPEVTLEMEFGANSFMSFIEPWPNIRYRETLWSSVACGGIVTISGTWMICALFVILLS
jgi:hypothetical protein